MINLKHYKIFDSHFHIIDKRFPLVPNNGYLPEEFTCEQYLQRTKTFDLAGGVVVSGSFQAFDQSYLYDALQKLGPRFVGVTQLPCTVSDEELIKLNAAGVRGIRFNLYRGGSEKVEHLESLSKRVYDTVGWHTELYLDSKNLAGLSNILTSIPRVSIDHLGLSKDGFEMLLKLVEHGVYVKASGFGRVNLDIKNALKELYSANPGSLIFGTDLPSPRVSMPYTDDDLMLVVEALGEEKARKVFYENAIAFYDQGQRTVIPPNESYSL